MKLTTKQTGKELQVPKTVLKVLLICGILSTLIYISIDILTATLYEGYSHTSQQISELSAIGASTRPLWIVMASVWTPLLIAFGIGVWLLAGHKRSLRLTGILLIVWGIIGFVWLFFPMHPRGTVGLDSDVMHLVLAAAQVLVMVLFISFGAVALGRGFRLYSIGTIVTLLVFGVLVSTQAKAIAAGQTTPWMGIIERVSVFTPMLWVVVLAILLMRSGKEQDSVNATILNQK